MEVAGERPALVAGTRPDVLQLLPPDPVLSSADLDRVWAAVDASTSVNTKAAYRFDWGRFHHWADDSGYTALPATGMVAAAYLTVAAAQLRPDGRPQFGAATLTRWVSSINQIHTAAGMDPPGRLEVVRGALAGVRRTRKTPPIRRSPLLLADVRRLMAELGPQFHVWPAAMAAHRDAALLLMGFTGAHRRSELVALHVGDVTVHRADGLHVRLRSSKTDQEGAGTIRALPYGKDRATCPPCALIRWRRILLAYDVGKRPAALTAMHHRGLATEHVCRDTDTTADDAAETDDPSVGERWLFPTVHRTGQSSRKAMTGDAVAMMIQRRAAAAAFTPAQVALSFAAVRVRHRSVPGRLRRRLDHAADRSQGPEDARGVRPGTRPPGRQRRHQAEPMTSQLGSAEVSAVTGKLLSAGTRAGYSADWVLFTDWCAATGRPSLPSDAATIAGFTAACPAAPATQRRRLTALQHHHRINGYQLPIDESAAAEPTRVPIDPGQVERAMRLLPSTGWVGGLFGRRDRALLSVAAHTQIPYRQIAALTVRQLHVATESRPSPTARRGAPGRVR